jgi:hypothetical protein
MKILVIVQMTLMPYETWYSKDRGEKQKIECCRSPLNAKSERNGEAAIGTFGYRGVEDSCAEKTFFALAGDIASAGRPRCYFAGDGARATQALSSSRKEREKWGAQREMGHPAGQGLRSWVSGFRQASDRNDGQIGEGRVGVSM